MKLINKFFVGTLVLCVLSGLSETYSAKIKWIPSCNSNVIQYTVFYTTNKLEIPITNIIPSLVDECNFQRPSYTNVYYGKYDLTNIANVNGYTNSECVITNLIRGVRYYFTVTCNTFAFQSLRSKEVTHMSSTNISKSKVNGLSVISFD